MNKKFLLYDIQCYHQGILQVGLLQNIILKHLLVLCCVRIALKENREIVEILV